MQITMFEDIGLLAYMIGIWISCLAVAVGLVTYLLDHWVASPNDLKDRWLADHLSCMTAIGLGLVLLLQPWALGPAGYVTFLDLVVGVSVLVVSVFLIVDVVDMKKLPRLPRSKRKQVFGDMGTDDNKVDEHPADYPRSPERGSQKVLRSNIRKSLEIGLSATVALALMFLLLGWPPTSSLAVFTYVAAPLLGGAIVFMNCFCLFTCKTANEEGKKLDYRSGGMSETVLTRRLEDEMNKTTDFKGYVLRMYQGREESRGQLVVFGSQRLTPDNIVLKVPEDIVSLLAKPEQLAPYIFTSIQLDRHVKGIMHASIMMFIVAVPLAIGSMLLLPILTGRDFLDSIFEFGSWIITPWIAILFVWAAAQTLKYMREERGIDRRATAEYPEFPTALRMLADSGFSPAYGHPPFKK